MPQPTINQVHINQALTNLSIAYMQDNENFAAGKFSATVPVPKSSGTYFIFNKNDFYRDEARRRAPGAPSAGGGFRVSTDTYSTERWAFHKDNDDETVEMYDSPLSADKAATIFVTQKLAIKREVQMAAAYMVAGTWGYDRVGANPGVPGTSVLFWDDAASDPIGDVKAAKRFTLTQTGFTPNRALTGQIVHDYLTEHPDFLDKIKYTQKGVVTADLIKEVFELEEYVVSKATRATNNEGAADAYARVINRDFFMGYMNPAPAIDQPSAGYEFSFSKFDKTKKIGGAIKKFRMEEIESWRIEGDMHFQFKRTGVDLGCIFRAITNATV